MFTIHLLALYFKLMFCFLHLLTATTSLASNWKKNQFQTGNPHLQSLGLSISSSSVLLTYAVQSRLYSSFRSAASPAVSCWNYFWFTCLSFCHSFCLYSLPYPVSASPTLSSFKWALKTHRDMHTHMWTVLIFACWFWFSLQRDAMLVWYMLSSYVCLSVWLSQAGTVPKRLNVDCRITKTMPYNSPRL